MKKSLHPENDRKHVFLIGFSGSGKSTIGPILAKSLGYRFADLDKLVEQRAGVTVTEIFRSRGQAYFRCLERDVMQEVVSAGKRRTVIALGGGAFLNSTNRQFAATHGVVVYLSSSAKELVRRMRVRTDRPLLQTDRRQKRRQNDLALRVKRLLEARLPGYHLADVKVSTTTKNPSETVSAIQKRLQKLNVATNH